jgi:hypothetical protein
MLRFLDEFKRWFYHEVDVVNTGPDFGDFDVPWGVADALRALGVSDQPPTHGGKNQIISFTHWEPKMEDEDEERVPMDEQRYLVRLDNGRVVELPVSQVIWSSVPLSVSDVIQVTAVRFTYAMNPGDGGPYKHTTRLTTL